MKLQQLRFLTEVVRRGMNVSAAAKALHTAQPGVSYQIGQLEKELNMPLFERNGKRLVGITQPGRAILAHAERILREVDNIKQVGFEFTHQAAGKLAIATTHTQACYALPNVIKEFTGHYPGVRLSIHQGNPTQIAELVASNVADIAIATEAIDLYEDLVMMPCYQWNRCVIAPPDHPVFNEQPLTLSGIADYPIITYDFAFAGRSKINKAFEEQGITPNIVLTAIDSDVIKTYVALGLGIGILANMAFDSERDTKLRATDASHLFEPSTTRIGLRRGRYLSGYMYAFIELFAPHLDRKSIDAAMTSS